MCKVTYHRRFFAMLGFCFNATVRIGLPVSGDAPKPGITCQGHRSRHIGTAPAVSRWNIAAFSPTFGSWQHQVITAVPMLGMALAALGTRSMYKRGRGARFWHNGLADLPSHRLQMPSLPEALHWRHTDELTSSSPGRNELRLANFAVAFPVPLGLGSLIDSFPDFAYLPYARNRSATGATHGTTRSRPFVAFVRRAADGPRHIVDEAGVLSTLNRTLGRLGLQLHPVPHDSPPPAPFFSAAAGVIGVHGGGLANLHACTPGTRVVEIVHPRGPRCYAALGLGLGLRYFAYFPRRMPLPYPEEGEGGKVEHLARGHGGAGRVEVDREHLAAFVAEVFAPGDARHRVRG